MKKLPLPPRATTEMYNRYFYLVQEPVVNKVLLRVNDEYPYWDTIKYMPPPEGVTKEELWHFLKFKRKAVYSVCRFGKHSFVWGVNNKVQEFLHVLDMNIGGSLESSSLISREDKNRYLVSSLMEEAIASSQIEGAVTTRKIAKEMLRKNQKPRNKSEQMIVNNYTTIQKILEIKAQPLNTANLLLLHKLVTANTMHNAAEEGALRQDDDVNVIDTATGNIVHHPPDVAELDEILRDLYTFFNDENDQQFIHPLIKGCIIHFMLGYIHPFADGNGRTARALFYWYLLKKGYWLTEYLSISRLILKSKGQYARAFQYTEIDEHDLTYFILFNLRTIKLAFEELRLYIQRKNEEKMKLTQFVQLADVSYHQALIIEWFYKDPSLLLTSKEAQNRLALSVVGARKNLTHLVEKGYLEVLALDKKSHGFIRSKRFESMISGSEQLKTKN